MTDTFIQSANEVETEEIFLALLEISHDSLQDDIYLVNNTTQIVSNGFIYDPYPFALSMPNDDESLPQVRLRIDNVDRSLVEAIRSFTTPPNIILKIILASMPDTIEILIDHLKLREINYNAYTITGNLVIDNPLGRNFGGDSMDGTQYAGLFYV